MLQQTQVATVIPYFIRWMSRFPTVADLAQADEQEVLSYWAGLGYYRRCRMLLAGARFVVAHGIPTTESEWRAVPGIGRYTAAAIASISQGVPAPLVDGNVERVYSRIQADRSVGSSLLQNAWRWAEEVLRRDRPGEWNQALMELGATLCKPVSPRCDICPVNPSCLAFQNAVQETLPTKSPKPTIISEFHTCWVPFHDSRFGLRQILEGQWWHGMWEFPRVVHEKDVDPTYPFAQDPLWIQELGHFSHRVTNRHIVLKVNLVQTESATPTLRWEPLGGVSKLALPSPQKKAFLLARTRLGL